MIPEWVEKVHERLNKAARELDLAREITENDTVRSEIEQALDRLQTASEQLANIAGGR